MKISPRPTGTGERVFYALLVVVSVCAVAAATIAIGDWLQPMPQPIRGGAR